MTDQLTNRETHVVESILENERLTANLNDDAAKVLLDWGIACAKTVVQSTTGLNDEDAEEEMYPQLRALRRMMRTTNRWHSNQQQGKTERSVGSVAKIVELAATVYGENYTPPADDQINMFVEQQTQFVNDSPQLIANLQAFVEGQVEKRDEEEKLPQDSSALNRDHDFW